jgi:exodeoxyribonuclease V beta subunit
MNAAPPQLIPLDAPTLVEASAGTGKTYTITTYFVRAILERDLTPEQILVVTYTKAATAELRVRTRERILTALALLDGPPNDGDVLEGVVARTVERLGREQTEIRLRDALGLMDQASILTIHGFCQRLLQDYPLSFGIDFDFEVAQDITSMYEDLAVDFWATDLYDKPDWLLRALDHRGVSIQQLAKLAGVAMMPRMEVLGPEPCGLDENALSEWLKIRREAGDLWKANREALSETLRKDERLNRRIYRARTIAEKWLPELDDFFAKTRFRFPPGFLQKIAQGKIRTKKNCDEPRHAFFEACTRLHEAHEKLVPGLDYEVFEVRRRFIEYARSHARKRQRDTAVLTFDDLLTTVYAPFDTSPEQGGSFARDRIAREVSKAYPLALIDEFQDTDSIQYGIFRGIYGESSAVYVGDPKQAIYAFRGADVFSYIEAANDVGQRKHTLATNRRSDPGVVRAVNTLFARRKPPFLLDEIDMEEAVPHHTESRSTFDPPMEVILLSEEQARSQVPPIVANEIALLLRSSHRIEQRPLEPGDIAVLCRTNKQALAVTKSLRALNVPVSLDGDSSVLNTEIATDLRAVLEATVMAGDSSLVRRAFLTSLLGMSPYEVATMSDERWSEWVARFHDWNATWHSQGVVRFLEDMLRTTGAETAIARHPAARRVLTDLLHLEELLLRGERERRRDPIALVQWFRRLDEETPDEGAIAYEDLQQRPDAESGAVRVSTIHKSKGLEYGIVFCPFTWGTASLWGFDRVAVKFHDSHRNIKLDLGSPDHEAHRKKSENEAFSEALRVLYVAVTRAKYRCTLFWGRGKDWNKSALGYLLHGLDGPGKPYDERIRKDVEAFVAASEGAASCRPAHGEQAARREHEAPSETLGAREQTRRFSHAVRIASFTSLTGHDEKTPGPRSGSSVLNSKSVLFSELPGGVRTGLLLHSVLEHVDFRALEADETGQLIERLLRGFGFDPALATAVQRDLRVVVETPLMSEPGAPRLINLTQDQQLRELEFTLCVDRPHLAGLAELFKQHGAPTAAPGYHERLAEVSSATLQRFLRGYIDLMFEWEGRWYVADYKSNTLPTYEADTVSEAVQREHYVLQAQLYTAAAHRYLKQRVRGYDPETDWGGTLFLFLRGMRGQQSAGSSVFFDRQPAELLKAVDRWLGGGR